LGVGSTATNYDLKFSVSFKLRYDKDDENERFLTIVTSDCRDWSNNFEIKYCEVFKKKFNFLVSTQLSHYMNEPLDLNADVRLMYVYADIVEYGIVGDVVAPQLRAIVPQGDRKETVSMTFSKPYYLPVSRPDQNTNDISINNELGSPMPFTGSKSAAVLHFRKRNHLI
jgi:hypothetical protein